MNKTLTTFESAIKFISPTKIYRKSKVDNSPKEKVFDDLYGLIHDFCEYYKVIYYQGQFCSYEGNPLGICKVIYPKNISYSFNKHRGNAFETSVIYLKEYLTEPKDIVLGEGKTKIFNDLMESYRIIEK